MAKRKGVSKSSVIREVLAEKPKATLAEVKEALAARKVKASDALINKLRTTRGKRTGKSKRKASANGEVNLDHLLGAKHFVNRVGGVALAKSALAQYASLVGSPE